MQQNQKWQNIFEIQKLVQFTKPTLEKEFQKPSHSWRRIRRKICKVMIMMDPNKHRFNKKEEFFATNKQITSKIQSSNSNK